MVDCLLAVLETEGAAHTVQLSEQEWPIFSSFQLLTAKPMLYCCNVKVQVQP